MSNVFSTVVLIGDTVMLNNCRFRLLLDIRQEIKPFPKIAIISQKYVVSQIEFVSGQNLTRESERHRYVYFTP